MKCFDFDNIDLMIVFLCLQDDDSSEYSKYLIVLYDEWIQEIIHVLYFFTQKMSEPRIKLIKR